MTWFVCKGDILLVTGLYKTQLTQCRKKLLWRLAKSLKTKLMYYFLIGYQQVWLWAKTYHGTKWCSWFPAPLPQPLSTAQPLSLSLKPIILVSSFSLLSPLIHTPGSVKILLIFLAQTLKIWHFISAHSTKILAKALIISHFHYSNLFSAFDAYSFPFSSQCKMLLLKFSMDSCFDFVTSSLLKTLFFHYIKHKLLVLLS